MMPIQTILLAAALTLASCAAPGSRSADEAEIQALIRQWDASAQARNVAAFTNVYADEAVVMLADVPDIRGLQSIREGIGGMMQDPNFHLTFKADEVIVSRSGDLAYETGTYALTMSASDGRPSREQGHYVVVWRKQTDGRWKVVIDAPLSDAPAAPASR